MSLLRAPRRLPRRPYPPRPTHPPRAEPTIDWRIRAAVALLGARRLTEAPALRRRLELTGLAWEEIAPVLARVRTIDAWAREFGRASADWEARGDCRRAAALAFLGQIVLAPSHPAKSSLGQSLRRCHIAERSARPGVRFERRILLGGALAAYRETPDGAGSGGVPVLLLPPLASTKEELTLLSDPLLAAGHPVIRLDLPGQGESPPPLTLHAEALLMQALDELGITPAQGLVVGGISLGAHFALRLAGADPGRVRGVVGISPPAIVTPKQWARQHEIIWQYLDRYFAAPTRGETLRLGLAMTLDDITPGIACPVLLYHAARDVVSLPDAPARFRAALAPYTPRLADRMLPDTHGCLLHLRDVIAPEVAAWSATLPIPAGLAVS